ncbi:MAG TPA: acyltransferase [Candidatus Eisenbergiella pullicola]|nr:acyltransferase [Candidatus Eisenbergiella pullicola]
MSLGKAIVAHKENAAVDIAKMAGCLGILLLHTGAYHEVPFEMYVQRSILSLIVPFFFVTSGYFFGCKIWNQDGRTLQEKFLKYEMSLLIPYLVFSIINSLFAAYDMYVAGESFLWGMLWLARAAIFYPYGALWYVWASMTGMLILYLFLRGNRLGLACIAGAICWTCGLLGNSYSFLFENTPIQRGIDFYVHIAVTTRNGLFDGFPLLLAGVLLAKVWKRFEGREGIKIGAIVLIISSVFLHGEICLVTAKNASVEISLFFSQVFWVLAALVLLLNCKWSGNPNTMRLIRKLSTAIYFVHRPLLTCMRYFLSWKKIELGSMQQFFLLTVLCLGICIPASLLWKRRRIA